MGTNLCNNSVPAETSGQMQFFKFFSNKMSVVMMSNYFKKYYIHEYKYIYF